MKKILSLMLVCVLAFGVLGGTVFAAEEDVIVADVQEEAVLTADEEKVIMEQAIEEMEFEMEADLADEEVIEEECADYCQLKDEFRILNEQRKVKRELLKDVAIKRIRIAVLKEKARIKEEFVRLETAGIIEKEIKVFNKIIHRVRVEKHGLWEEFKAQIGEGNIDGAEKTLKKIILTKMLINENLRHMMRFMEIEIEVLN